MNTWKVLLAFIMFSFLTSPLSAQKREINSYEVYPSSDVILLNNYIASLAKQLTLNKTFKNTKDSRTIISTFVSLDDYKSFSKLSYILSENLIYEMQIRGFTIVDSVLTNLINTQNIKQDDNIAYVLSGTYIKFKDGTQVNARIIERKTNAIVSSAKVFIPKQIFRQLSKQHKGF